MSIFHIERIPDRLHVRNLQVADYATVRRMYVDGMRSWPHEHNFGYATAKEAWEAIDSLEDLQSDD